jgi:DNA-binding MarR family transcriptional regulator
MRENTCSNAGTHMTQQERIVRELAGFGNLFLVLTLPEIRRQGMTYLSLYALQRAVQIAEENSGWYFPQVCLRNESGLSDYETSRACKLLEPAGLIQLAKADDDGRERLLIPTELGKRVLARIMRAAGQRLWDSIDDIGRFRRIREATEHLRRAHHRLRGPLQLSFFEKELTRKGRNRDRAVKR